MAKAKKVEAAVVAKSAGASEEVDHSAKFGAKNLATVKVIAAQDCILNGVMIAAGVPQFVPEDFYHTHAAVLKRLN